MKGLHFFTKVHILWMLVLSFTLFGTAATDGRNDYDNGVDVMLRGPIHEAFADPGVDEGEPEFVTRHRVPDPIDEIAPDHRPHGNYVAWIPGYWNWDRDLDDFIWISGIWRGLTAQLGPFKRNLL